MSQIKVDNEFDEDESALQCPACGGGNLHQDRVEIFDRFTEDSPAGVHVNVADNKATVDALVAHNRGNPSPRRDGVRIHFNCEGCDDRSFLDVYQHKGTTFLRQIVSGEMNVERILSGERH